MEVDDLLRILELSLEVEERLSHGDTDQEFQITPIFDGKGE